MTYIKNLTAGISIEVKPMRLNVPISSMVIFMTVGGLLSGCFYTTKEVETVPAPAPVVEAPPPVVPPIVQVPAPVAPANGTAPVTKQTTTTSWGNGAVVQKKTTTSTDGAVQNQNTTTWSNGNSPSETTTTTTTSSP